MEPVEGYPVDPYNPKNVQGIKDQPLANDYWFNNVTDPRIVNVFIDLFGPDIDFHNGKVRNNPPGLHQHPGLAPGLALRASQYVGLGRGDYLPGRERR